MPDNQRSKTSKIYLKFTIAQPFLTKMHYNARCITKISLLMKHLFKENFK